MKKTILSLRTLAPAPWFDEHLKHSAAVRNAGVGQADLQRKLNDYQTAPHLKEHPQYGLWKVTTVIVVLLFLVIIGTSLYATSPTGYASSYNDSSSVSGVASLVFVILLMFGFLVLLFYRRAARPV